MTSTMISGFPTDILPWKNIFFAEDADKDLDFDEGLEDDELHESKPPSRRPLLWILLLVLGLGVAYWVLNKPIPLTPKTSSSETAQATATQSPLESSFDVPPPLFRENQVVQLGKDSAPSMLMGDLTNSLPGPMVQSGDHLTVLDGSYELRGWVYLVETTNGKTGWISEEKLQKRS